MISKMFILIASIIILGYLYSVNPMFAVLFVGFAFIIYVRRKGKADLIGD